ncbi:uncharacterized protein LOC106663621 isoform X2 [Cimex lectularius]|uniref:MICOS complex subunit n=1 Tax=Cimex lectularius TaxID=79782 RepID=A0A8I6RHL4_CIMLE|nr:uncharacterized protein LOC106663621 isoform X2 [Cimex lectularius]
MSSNKDGCYPGIRVHETNVPDCRFPFLCAPVKEKKRSCRKGWFGRKCPLPDIDNQEVSCVYRPLFKLGLIWIAILRHLLFPVSCGSPVVHAKSKDGESGKVRASDLPLYAEEDKVVKCANDCPKSLIEETICCLRQELEILISQGKIVKAQVSDFVHTSSAVTQDTIKFLRKDENSVPRYGAIAIGSASGYILALRKGIFKRLLYTTAGGSAVAALCYPCEAKQFAGEAVVHAKRYFVIGYHLLNGVTSDLFGFQLPALPMGHLVVTDEPHPPPDAVPSSVHLLPPVATPTHIPLPNEDPHVYEIKKLVKSQD